jgi:hypothetical protein
MLKRPVMTREAVSKRTSATKQARILTDTPIRRSLGCATTHRTACLAMALVSPIKFSDEERLYVLQRLDQFRQWHSLDEKRYCLVCGEMITGREIQVIWGKRENRPLRIICPTERCNAIPMEWVRPTDEVLIRIAMAETERRRIRWIIRAGRAMRSAQKKISRTRLKPPL